MSSKRLGLLALVVTAMLVAACAPQTDQGQVATLQAQLAAAQAQGQNGAQNSDAVATLQAQLTQVAANAPQPTAQPSFNPTFKNPDTITYQTIGDPQTLDPALDYETTGQNDIISTYDTLVFFKGSSVTDFVPMLAEKWDVSPDGKTYTFTIRKGVTFHNGDELKASDVAYTFQRDILTGWYGDLGGPQALLAQPIFGVTSVDDLSAKYGGDEQACQAVQKALVADDSAGTFTLTMVNPATYILQIIGANSFGAIQDQKFVQSKGGWDGDCKTWRKFIPDDISKSPLFNVENGTGPYILDHWTPNDELVLKANDKWWVKEPLWEGSSIKGVPTVKTIVMKNVTEWSTRLAALQAGDADIIDVSAAYYDQIDPMVKEYIEGPEAKADKSNVSIKNPNGSLRMWHAIPQPLSADMFLNQKINVEGGNPLVGSGKLDGQGIPPDFFSDLHVRKAFNYCFDRDTYITQVTKGEAEPHRGPIIRGLPGFDEKSEIYTYDTDKCKAELDQAWNGDVQKNGFTLTLAYNSGNDNRRIANEILRDGLEKAYGGSQGKLTISIVSMAWPAYLDARAKGRLPVNTTGWLEDFQDSWDWVHPYMSCNGDFSGQQGIDPKVCGAWDDLMTKAVTSTDPAEAEKIYTQLQKEANDQAIDIFIDQGNVRWYQQMWIGGWFYQPLFVTPYWAGLTKSQ